jgi:predicted HicB family RNase H-like nuclease
LCYFCKYKKDMARKRGRPQSPPEKAKEEILQVRLETVEKQTLRNAAELAGIPLSTWVRERLRRDAREELEQANLPVPFLARKAAPRQARN